MRNKQHLALGLILGVSAALAAVPGRAQPVDTARIAAGSPNDWLTYHGAYNGWNYSGLHQINPSTVKDLSVAWIHVPGRSTRGLQSVPLVADGVLYYTGSYSRVFALNGATGQVIWSYFPELDEALVARQTHSPYNRGVALGQGKVLVGSDIILDSIAADDAPPEFRHQALEALLSRRCDPCRARGQHDPILPGS